MNLFHYHTLNVNLIMYCKSYPVLFVYQIVIFVMKKIKLFFISKYEGKYSSVIMIKKKIVERDVKYD